jgi:FXSXX-COOH protein
MSRGRVSCNGQDDASQGADVRPERPAHVDLTAISLARLRTVDSPVLAECLARILRESKDAEAPTAQFNSAV